MNEADRIREHELARSQGVLPVGELSDLSRADLGRAHTVTLVVHEEFAARAQREGQATPAGSDGEVQEHQRQMAPLRREE